MKEERREEQTMVRAERIDELFDAGSDQIDDHLDWANSRRPGREVQRVNVDFPVDLLRALDREARRIGVSRQAFIKLRLADTLTRQLREAEGR